MWSKLFYLAFRRPWFRLKLQDAGDVIEGKCTHDGVEITVTTGWNSFLVKLSREEAIHLRNWLIQTYPEGSNGIAKVLPLPVRPTKCDT